jgi:hypothetical protein
MTAPPSGASRKRALSVNSKSGGEVEDGSESEREPKRLKSKSIFCSRVQILLNVFNQAGWLSRYTWNPPDNSVTAPETAANSAARSPLAGSSRINTGSHEFVPAPRKRVFSAVPIVNYNPWKWFLFILGQFDRNPPSYFKPDRHSSYFPNPVR